MVRFQGRSISHDDSLYDVKLEFSSKENATNQAIPSEPVFDSFYISDEVERLLDKGLSYYLQAKYEEALSIADQIIKINSNLPDAYDLIACVRWRQKNYKAVVMASTKVIELDNLYYSAYNMLGIGYAGQGIANESLKNYKICLEHELTNYIIHWNMALSYQDLQEVASIPATLRNQFKRDFEEKIAMTITLTNQQENADSTYHLYATRGQAFLKQGKVNLANNDLIKAHSMYKEAPKNERDVHILREIKDALNEVNWLRKQ